MSTTEPSAEDRAFVSRTTEAAIRIGLVFLLALWCWEIVRPFIDPLLWAVILAVAIYPLYERLESAVGGRSKLAAAIVVITALALVLVPAARLSGSAYQTSQEIASGLREGTLEVPPPPESVAGWPFVGERIHQIWQLASTNLEEALRQLAPHLKDAAGWLLGQIASAGVGVGKAVFSIVIAGALLATAGGGRRASSAIARRLAGTKAEEFVDVAVATVRSVTQGVLGVAFIQGLLAGIGMVVAGVPAAGLWGLAVLVLAVVQLPSLIVLGPVIVYVFSAADTVTAVIFAIWSLLVGGSDSLLKPLLLGRGVAVPMPVILLGAIGGMVVNGIIGLFTGSVILAVSYMLFMEWLGTGVVTADAAAEPEAG